MVSPLEWGLQSSSLLGSQILGEMPHIGETVKAEGLGSTHRQWFDRGHRRVVAHEPLPLPGDRADPQEVAKGDGVRAGVGDHNNSFPSAIELPQSLIDL
jgi:hypothetical protein